MITIYLEPEGKKFALPKANTVLQLLNKLDLRSTDALIIRDNGLLTPDTRIQNGDHITVQKVGSRG